MAHGTFLKQNGKYSHENQTMCSARSHLCLRILWIDFGWLLCNWKLYQLKLEAKQTPQTNKQTKKRKINDHDLRAVSHDL